MEANPITEALGKLITRYIVRSSTVDYDIDSGAGNSAQQRDKSNEGRLMGNQFEPLPRYTIPDHDKTCFDRFNQQLVDWLHRGGD